MLAKFGAQGCLKNSLRECIMGGGCALGRGKCWLALPSPRR